MSNNRSQLVQETYIANDEDDIRPAPASSSSSASASAPPRDRGPAFGHFMDLGSAIQALVKAKNEYHDNSKTALSCQQFIDEANKIDLPDMRELPILLNCISATVKMINNPADFAEAEKYVGQLNATPNGKKLSGSLQALVNSIRSTLSVAVTSESESAQSSLDGAAMAQYTSPRSKTNNPPRLVDEMPAAVGREISGARKTPIDELSEAIDQNKTLQNTDNGKKIIEYAENALAILHQKNVGNKCVNEVNIAINNIIFVLTNNATDETATTPIILLKNSIENISIKEARAALQPLVAMFKNIHKDSASAMNVASIPSPAKKAMAKETKLAMKSFWEKLSNLDNIDNSVKEVETLEDSQSKKISFCDAICSNVFSRNGNLASPNHAITTRPETLYSELKQFIVSHKKEIPDFSSIQRYILDGVFFSIFLHNCIHLETYYQSKQYDPEDSVGYHKKNKLLLELALYEEITNNLPAFLEIMRSLSDYCNALVSLQEKINSLSDNDTYTLKKQIQTILDEAMAAGKKVNVQCLPDITRGLHATAAAVQAVTTYQKKQHTTDDDKRKVDQALERLDNEADRLSHTPWGTLLGDSMRILAGTLTVAAYMQLAVATMAVTSFLPPISILTGIVAGRTIGKKMNNLMENCRLFAGHAVQLRHDLDRNKHAKKFKASVEKLSAKLKSPSAG